MGALNSDGRPAGRRKRLQVPQSAAPSTTCTVAIDVVFTARAFYLEKALPLRKSTRQCRHMDAQGGTRASLRCGVQVAALLCVVLPIVGCQVPTNGTTTRDAGIDMLSSDAGAPSAVELHVLNLSPGGPNFDLRIGSRPTLSVESLGFGRASSPLLLPSGAYDFTFLSAGTTAPRLLSVSDVVLTTERTFSLVATDLSAAPHAFLIENATHPTVPNEIQARLVSTVDTLGPLNVLLLVDDSESVIYANISNGVVSEALPLPADGFVLGIDKNGDRHTDHRFSLPPLPEFGTSNIYVIPNGADVFLFVEPPNGELLRFDPSV